MILFIIGLFVGLLLMITGAIMGVIVNDINIFYLLFRYPLVK